MTKAQFDAMFADPKFQALPTSEKQKVVRAAREGTWTFTGPQQPEPTGIGTDEERPPGAPTGRAVPDMPEPQPGVTPARGVLNQPTDVETDDLGRVRGATLSRFGTQADNQFGTARDVAATAPQRTIGQNVGRTFGEPAKIATETALPLAGAAGGAFVGGLTAPVTGPVGAVAGEMAGSAGGEWLNQKLGITEEDPTQIAIAGAGPGVARGVAKGIGMAAKGVSDTVRSAPGVWEALRDRGLRKVSDAIATSPATKDAVDTAYDVARRAARGASMITMPETRKAIDEWVQGLAKGPAAEAIERKANLLYRQTINLLQRPRLPSGRMGPGTVGTFQDIVNQFDRIGQSIRGPSGKSLGQIKHLWGSMITDLDNAAQQGHVGSDVLLKAKDIFKHRLGITTLSEALDSALEHTANTPTSIKAAQNKLTKAMNEIIDEQWLPKNVEASLADLVEKFRKLQPSRWGLLEGMLGSGSIAAGLGGMSASLAALGPRAVWNGLRNYGVKINPVAVQWMNAAYQMARRLDLAEARQNTHRGGNPESDYGLDPNERDMAEAP